MKRLSTSILPVALTLALACTPALAQNSKQALATKLAQLQVQLDGEMMTNQLTGSAVAPLVAEWSLRIRESVPRAKQDDVRERLDAELQKLSAGTVQDIQGQLQAAAEAVLVPLYMERLSEDELRLVITYLESPASEKFQSLSRDATEAWGQKIVDTTQPQVKARVDAFEASAIGIVGVSGNEK